MPYDGQVLIPTLIGSLLSCVATICVLTSYVVYANQQQSFRHALVLNLALAEFINSLNNSISGIYVLTHGKTTLGLPCTINGWVGQWSVQAADFSILAIAIITLLTITRKTYMPNASLLKKVLICASVWVVPTFTASIAAGLNQITPVSGNWCWISDKRTELRYALGHGWRFSIVFVTIWIYTYIWIHMQRHFKELNLAATGGRSYSHGIPAQCGEFRQGDAFELRSESQTELNKINAEYRFEVKHIESEQIGSSTGDGKALNGLDIEETVSVSSEKGSYLIGSADNKLSVPSSPMSPTSPIRATTVESSGPIQTSSAQEETRQARNVEREIKKMLLLNAYPVLYIILWTPGMLNRLVEATGHKSRVLSILQCSTQYIGLANAITYGFNGDLRRSLKTDLVRLYGKR